MRRLTLLATTLLPCIASAQGTPLPADDPQVQVVQVRPIGPAAVVPRDVDLAICLDTSGSMEGLIEAAKQKLWAIVNELALAEPEPRLRVALLTFGNNGHDPERGWVALDVGLTTDLDLVSQKLFALSTNGGTELVGRVLGSATDRLAWSNDPLALRLIVVAGNESADQDREVPFRDACRKAIARGIMVNSIYCGGAEDSVAAGWREVAKLADGHYASIDHHGGTLVVETPFDAQLSALSTALNDTYVPLGGRGREGVANQSAQDSNAASLNGEAAAGRARTKAGKLYWNAWDLVDASRAKGFEWKELKDEDLPEAVRSLDLGGRKAYVEEKWRRRRQIQEQIETLDARRGAWIAEKRRAEGLDDSHSFDRALSSALRAQAQNKGFRFKAAKDPRP